MSVAQTLFQVKLGNEGLRTRLAVTSQSSNMCPHAVRRKILPFEIHR